MIAFENSVIRWTQKALKVEIWVALEFLNWFKPLFAINDVT